MTVDDAAKVDGEMQVLVAVVVYVWSCSTFGPEHQASPTRSSLTSIAGSGLPPALVSLTAGASAMTVYSRGGASLTEMCRRPRKKTYKYLLLPRNAVLDLVLDI